MGQHVSRSTSEAPSLLSSQNVSLPGLAGGANNITSIRKGRQLSFALASMSNGAAQPAGQASLGPTDLGKALVEGVKAQEGQLLALEGQVGEHMLEGYQEQVRAIEPTIVARGEKVGELLLSALSGGSNTAMSYSDVLDTALNNPVLEKLDPFMTPVLLPFVEGLKVPINKEIDQVKKKVELGLVAAVLGGAAGGYVLGRLAHRPRSRR